MKSTGVLQAPLTAPAAGTDTNCEARWSSLRLLLGAVHGEGGHSSPPGPGELGIVPGSFTGGQYPGDRTPFPSPYSQSQPF